MAAVPIITRRGITPSGVLVFACASLGLAACGGPLFHPQTRVDADLDGFYAAPAGVNLRTEVFELRLTVADLESQKLDCDDADPNTFPNAAEQCDGEDNNCDAKLSPDERDDDGDGYTECGYRPSDIPEVPGEFTGEKDCNDDTTTGIYQNPGRQEVCAALPLGLPPGEYFESRPDQGLDDDCDGNILEDEVDRDRDGHMLGCEALDLGDGLEPPNEGDALKEDCHDGRPDINPSIPEEESGCIPDDAWVDEDNQGLGHNCEEFDEGDRTVWYPNLDYDRDGDMDPSSWEYLCDGEQPPGYVPGEPGNSNWLEDFRDVGGPTDCEPLNPQKNGEDLDLDGYTPCDDPGDIYPGGVSADDQASVYPGAPEICDGLDNDLDTQVDEIFDLDDDGSFSDPDPSGDPQLDGCEPTYGLGGIDCNDNDSSLNNEDADEDGASTCGGDCNDGDPRISVADDDGDGVTTCGDDTDGDGVLDILPDCDDYVPEVNSLDDDGDGFSPCGPDGISGTADDDCDDDDPTSFPGAPNICDTVDDNDCDGATDPNEIDIDQDGFTLCQGDCDNGNALLTPADADSDGFSTCDGECDDGNASVFPGAPQQCETGADPVVLDNDCNGIVDPNHADVDGDSNSLCDGDCNDNDPSVEALDADFDGFSTCDGDCNDVLSSGGAGVNPGVDGDGDGWDVCGGFGLPADCDDSDASLNFNDVDGDGNASCPVDTNADGIADLAGDCDDLDPVLNQGDADGDGETACNGDCDDVVGSGENINTGQSESRNGLDDNCDGTADEGLIGTGDLAVVEMMISTDPATVGGDGNGEYLELYNPTTQPIDLRGWLVTVSNDVTGDSTAWSFPCSGTSGLCSSTEPVDPIVVDPNGGRFVLARSNNEAAHGLDIADFHWEVIPFVDGEGSVAFVFDGIPVDSLTWHVSGCSSNCDNGNTSPTYDSSNGSPFSYWRPAYATSLKSSSLGLSAHTDNDEPTNWCEESGDLGGVNFGSPGFQGSVGACG